MSDESPPLVKIVIPGEPKGRKVHARAIISKKTGKPFAMAYTPTDTRNEAAVIRDGAVQAMKGEGPLTGPIDLRLKIFMSLPKTTSKKNRAMALAVPSMLRPTRKPDWDNVGKFLDQLKGIVWVDDAQVTDAHVFKRFSDQPRLVIEVRRAC
ncbi:MAG: RusA family crossover junction endodeoxyribonuclease [Pseudomonadota bacterium]|nr:RusA family crossover junction endodeoxyribonuclease [Pseudomonadota bacterium]